MSECVGESVKTLQQPVIVRCQQMVSQGWIGTQRMCTSTPVAHQAFCHRHKESCDRSAVAVSRGRKTCCEGRCMWNEMILLLILALALIPGVGHQFCSQPLVPATPLGERTVPASRSPTGQPPKPVGESRDQELEQGVRASDRKGEVQELVSRLTEIIQKGRERPDGTKEPPFDVGSSPANQPLLGEEGDV